MKKFLFILLVTLSFGVSMYATDSNDFNLDYNAVQSEFKGLNELSSMVASNPDLTYTSLEKSNISLVSSLNLLPSASVPAKSSGNAPLGIPSIAWGCVFSVLGVVLVYVLTEEDKSETKKAAIGCLISAVLWGGWWFIF